MRTARAEATTPSQVRRHRPDYQIVLYMGLLMLFGLIIMYAIGPQRAQVLNTLYGTDFYGSTYFFIKQGASLLLALAAFMLCAKIPSGWFGKNARTLLFIGFGACVVLAISGWLNLPIAKCSLGACRWFELGPLGSLQPAEYLKFALLIFVAYLLGTRVKSGLVNDRDATLIPLAVVVGAAILFVIGLQKDMGTGAAMLAIIASMVVAAGINKKTVLTILGAIVGVGVLLIVIAPHRMERITTFFAGDTVSTTGGDTYHIAHAKIAIGSGGFFGVGIGNSVQATGYLPEAINDSVFAIMGETFGFIGLTVILILFTALLLRVLRVADLLPDMTARLIAVGVFGWLGAHVILNVAAMTGILPLTGITLPLLSFGGTSMVFIAGALGLVFQLSRYTNYELTQKGQHYANTRSGRGVGRTRYASRRGY